MNYHEYQALFDKVLDTENPWHPYNSGGYLNYTRLNRSRMRRWDKQLELDPALSERLQQIKTPQHWIIITEPWCGDAAHIVPFLVRMAAENSLITYDIRLRDSEHSLIDAYLTNGAKSIPKLVVRDQHQTDIFT